MVDSMILQNQASILDHQEHSSAGISSALLEKWSAQSWPVNQSLISKAQESQLLSSSLSVQRETLTQLVKVGGSAFWTFLEPLVVLSTTMVYVQGQKWKPKKKWVMKQWLDEQKEDRFGTEASSTVKATAENIARRVVSATKTTSSEQ